MKATTVTKKIFSKQTINIFSSFASKSPKVSSFSSAKNSFNFQQKKTNLTIQAKSFSTSAAATETKSNDMFCFQCEQTEEGTGCTVVGVCGKTPEVSRLQDLLMAGTKNLGEILFKLGKHGVRIQKADHFVLAAMFSTLTNVNFDENRFVELLAQLDSNLKEARKVYSETCKKMGKQEEKLSPRAQSWTLTTHDVASLVAEAKPTGIEERKATYPKESGADLIGLQELIFYGLKGTAAYAEHAMLLGKESDEVYQSIAGTLDFLSRDQSVPDYLGKALDVGQINLKVMELLDAGHVARFGHPEPTVIKTSAVKGKCIAISGHDLSDLEDLLKQTEGKGVNVYTHGEMLPAHGYPNLKKYKHLVANYGGAWQNQKFEFATFPGPIIMTSNCIIEPRKQYKDRIYTKRVVGWPGVKHLTGNDYSQAIKQALEMPGFTADEKLTTAMTGFGRNAVLSIAGQVIDAVKSGAVKHFFLIGGCDGNESERNYFKEVALATPKDTIILTLACGKFRFNKLDFGTIGGIPRLLDMGQCNDSFSAIQVASALAGAFKTDVNGLPLSFVVSWLEQKAVAVLLTLLSLNIKGIRLGTALPAFVTPNMMKILVDKFDIRPIGDAKKDVQDMLLKQ